MSISKGHPTFETFAQNEFQTLKFLVEQRSILKSFNGLYNAIQIAYSNVKAQIERSRLKKINCIDFHACFNIKIEGLEKGLVIGAIVREGFTECSYTLSVLNSSIDSSPLKLIRKFHFDYAIADPTRIQTSPAYHFQYGGKLSPKMTEMKIDDEAIERWLSLPRLNYYPFNLALLLDLLFCEFRTTETNKIVEDAQWRNLIYKNEQLIIKHYYKNIADHLEKSNKNCLSRDFFYNISPEKNMPRK